MGSRRWPVTRLAVLPFENLGDTSGAYFAEGIADDIRGKLAGLPALTVIASTSSNQYRHTTKAPRQIAHELDVQYLLMGHVQWDKRAGGAGRVRVSPELVEAATGATKWQQPFDAALTDVFQVQADIAGRVAEALGVALGASERQRLTERPTDNLAAYDAFLQGEAVFAELGRLGRPIVRRALGFYERAVALDSTFAPAWAQLARARASLYANWTPTATLAEGAQKAAERAQALAPGRPEAQLAWGWYLFFVRGDFAEALQAFGAGIRQDPANAELLAGAAQAEAFLGRWEAALQHFQRAQAIDPRAVRPPSRLTRTLLWSRRWAEARRAADQALALAPTNLDMFSAKVESYLGQGDLGGARAVLRGAPRRSTRRASGLHGPVLGPGVGAGRRAAAAATALEPGPFNNDRAGWGITLAQTYWVRGHHARARIYADSARLAFEEQLRGALESTGLESAGLHSGGGGPRVLGPQGRRSSRGGARRGAQSGGEGPLQRPVLPAPARPHLRPGG